MIKTKTIIGFLKFFSRMFNPDKYEEVNNASSVIKKWKENNNQIIFLSSRPHNIKAIRNSALSWLNSHNVPYDALVLGCKNKGKFCKEFNVDVLVDDNLSHCKSAYDQEVSSINLTNKNEINFKQENKKYFMFKAENWDKVDFFLGLIQLKCCKAPKLHINEISIFDYIIKDNKVEEYAKIITQIKKTDLASTIVFNKKYNIENVETPKKK